MIRKTLFRTRSLLLWTMLGVAGTGYCVAAAQGPGGILSSDQVRRGKVAYDNYCAGCHQADLSGQGDAPPLTGEGFMIGWGEQTVSDLYIKIHDTMPYGAGKSLDQETYLDLVAYILSSGGAKAGGVPLAPGNSTKISAVVSAAGAPVAQAPAATPREAAPAPEGEPRRPARSARGNDAPFVPGLSVAGTVAPYTDVDDAMLRNPSPNDWLMYRGGYRGWSYSPLKQIDRTNVDRLQLAWSWAILPGATLETTPIVHEGIMFLWNPGNVIQALHADTGELIWENRIGPAPTRSFGAGADANRTLAVWKDKVYVATHEARLYALEARTGKIAWQTEIGEPGASFQTTAGVMVINGKVLSGLTSCGSSGSPNRNVKEHCYISAYDAETGKRIWKFKTVALSDQPGGDTWNGIPDDHRAGGESWILGTYDPELNTTYWGTAQAKPWRRDLRGTGSGATLYTSNTLALDPDTGQLKWHFSHLPGESFDLDEAFERILVDNGDRKTLLTAGKPGILWQLDRVTGKYLNAEPMLLGNIYTLDKATGHLSMRPDAENQKPTDWISSCPSPQGGHDWQAMSFHKPSGLLLAPLSQSCVMMLGNGSQKLFPMPGSDGNLGRLSAYNAATLEPVWTFQQRSPFLSAVLSTGGDVAFVGDFDRVFRAIDVKSGQTLWKTRLGTTVQGHPITFSVNGKQYVAITAGLGGGSPQQKPMALLTEVHRPMNNNQIYVFALPETRSGRR